MRKKERKKERKGRKMERKKERKKGRKEGRSICCNEWQAVAIGWKKPEIKEGE